MGRSKRAACPVCKCPTCPDCPKPIYNENTCGNLIKSAVDAKKCASILGIQYNDSNKNVNNLMISLQNIINKIQEIVCSSQLKYKLINSINNMKYDQSVRPSDEVLGQLKQELNNLINKVDPSLGITKIQLIELRDVMAMLIGTIVSVSSVDGKISINNVKNLWISILDSVCLDYKAPERMDQPFMINYKAPERMDQPRMINYKEPERMDQPRISSDVEKVMMNSGNELQQAITLEQEQAHIREKMREIGDKMSQETDPIKKQDLFKEFQELGKKNTANISAKIKLLPRKAELESGKISSMSMFGVEKVSETTPGRNYGSIMMWLFVLIIVAVAAYFLYKNKNKLKMPSLSRQISNFGRQIKAVRRM